MNDEDGEFMPPPRTCIGVRVVFVRCPSVSACVRPERGNSEFIKLWSTMI